MEQATRFNTARMALLYVTFGVCVLVFAAYCTIISHSYFFQDDFSFWPHYSTLRLSDLFRPSSNFGRPITRDLYFYLTSHLLGWNSSNYFVLNLGVITGVCALVYRTLRELKLDPWMAATAAAVYFYMPPTVPHASWISNSQHTIAHLFAFWFISSTLRGVNSGNPRILRSVLIYALAMFSNVSSLFALVFVGFHIVLRNHRSRVERFLPLLATITLLAVCTLAWSLAISHSANVHYKLDLSLEHSVARAHYYDDLLREGLLGSWYRLLFVAVVALTLVNLRRNYEITLPLASALLTSFGMLFFLGDQRTLGYLAVPYLMLGLMLFSNFSAPAFREGEGRSWVLLVLSFSFIFYSIENGAPTRDSFMASPYGSGIREVQSAVRNVVVSGDTTYCFAPAEQQRSQDIAPFWIFLGQGKAFWLVDYADNHARRFLYYTDPQCSEPNVVRVKVAQKSATLAVTEITGAK